MVNKHSTTGHVYFVLAREQNLVKIGYTDKDPYLRLSALRTGSPVKLEPAYLIAAHPCLERALHRRFRAYRSHLEWFHLVEPIHQFMSESGTPWMDNESPEPEELTSHAKSFALVDTDSVYPFYHDTKSGKKLSVSRRDRKRFGK